MRLRRVLAAALLSVSLHPAVHADEFDWLYFPMYTGDTAHAVHLSVLKFRPDGLLSAGTRYPRHGDEEWTREESDAGWYSYAERLIDCETGFFLETADALLDRDSVRQVTRPTTKKAQVERLTGQLQSDKGWPKNSDVFLACAAASNPALRQQRAQRAKKPLPLLSATSLIETLSGDTAALSALVSMKYDFSRVARRKAATGADLFNDMRAQMLAWRRASNAPYQPRQADARADQAVLALIKQGDNEREVSAIERIQGPIVEHVIEHNDFSFLRSDADARRSFDIMRTDCDNGLSVPVAYRKLHPDGRTRASAAQLARKVLPDIMRRYGQAGTEGPFGGHQLDEAAAAVCAIVAGHRHPAASDDEKSMAADTLEQAFQRLPYGLTPALLEHAASPAAMLLAVRDARRKAAR